jgi:exodeoxyribonuclease-1
MSFIFYDTETTGLNSAFNQILQFGAIRTDADLEEIERFEVRSRLLPYVVPSPGALRVTGLTIDDLVNPAHPTHYEMVCEIQRWLSGACPTTFIGYNSLRFDEEFLRQSFYQCLHPPYLTNTGGNSRADAMHLIRAAALLHPDHVAVGIGDNGRPSFRLERIAPANGFNFINAHDAMADVEALIFMCKIVRDRCPQLWARFQRFSGRAAVIDFIKQEPAFLIVEFYPGRTGQFVATAIGQNPDQQNLEYCYDLAVDPADLRDLTVPELADRLGRSPKPLRKVKKNAAPCLCPLSEAPDQFLGGVFPAEYVRRAGIIRSDRGLVERLIAAASYGETVYDPSPYVEKQIYDGFWSFADGDRMRAFHRVSWEERVVIAERFQDPRLVWLARRLIFVERPHLLAREHHASLAAEKAGRILATSSGGWTTLEKATEELADITPGLEGDAVEAFRRLGAHFDAWRIDLEAVLTP